MGWGLKQEQAFDITLYEARDVRDHPTGHVSVELNYSGWSFPASYATDRFYLLPSGGRYVIDDWVPRKVRVPDDMTLAKTSLLLTDEGITLAETDFEAVNVVVLEAENASSSASSAQVFRLDEPDIATGEAQARLLAQEYEGLDFVGATPLRLGETWMYAFVVEAGETYLIQQNMLNEDGQNPQPIAGEEYVTTFLVAEEESK